MPELNKTKNIEEFNLNLVPSARLHELREELDFLEECAENYTDRLEKSFTQNF